MKLIYCLFFFAALLASCSSAIQDAAPPPTSTFTPDPTAPPTPIPLADLDLASILIQPGDLPTVITGALVRNSLPWMYDGIAKPVNQIYQEFEYANDSAGGVAVIVYDSQAEAINTYNTILDGMSKPEAVQDVGEKAQISSTDLTSMGGDEMLELLFLRCNTVVHIRMVVSTNQDSIISYAQRLDDRLSKIVCP